MHIGLPRGRHCQLSALWASLPLAWSSEGRGSDQLSPASHCVAWCPRPLWSDCPTAPWYAFRLRAPQRALRASVQPHSLQGTRPSCKDGIGQYFSSPPGRENHLQRVANTASWAQLTPADVESGGAESRELGFWCLQVSPVIRCRWETLQDSGASSGGGSGGEKSHRKLPLRSGARLLDLQGGSLTSHCSGHWTLSSAPVFTLGITVISIIVITIMSSSRKSINGAPAVCQALCPLCW